MPEKETKENIYNVVMKADLSEYEKDFLKRLIDVVPDFLENLVEHNYSGDLVALETFINGGEKPMPDIYSEIPNTDFVEDKMISAIDNSKIYFYSDSDNDGKHALAMFNYFCKIQGVKPEVATLSDITIKSLDAMEQNTSHHGLNSNQFIKDYMKNPVEGPITIMTADNGISSQPDIEKIRDFCDEQGLEVSFIITDHHLPDPDTKTIAARDVTILDLELNEDHGRYTLSGAQTLGELLKKVTTKIRASSTDDSDISMTSHNRLNRVVDTLGIRSAVADVTHSGYLLQKNVYSEYSSSASLHNKIRGIDFFLKNIPKNSPFQEEAREIQAIAKNFLIGAKNVLDGNASVDTLKRSLYAKSSAETDGGFTALPHIQPIMLEIEAKYELKIATLPEIAIKEIFETQVIKRLVNFRKKVIKDTRENASEKVNFESNEVMEYKGLNDSSFSTSFANQVFPAGRKPVTLTTRPLDTRTGLVTGSFRSIGIKLQELLSPELIESLASKGITDPTIKGHSMAAGFKAKVDPSCKDYQKVIYEEFTKEVGRQIENKTNQSESTTIPVLEDPRDVLAFREVLTALGMFGAPGDYDLKVTVANVLDSMVVNKEGRNVLVGDIISGKEEPISGFVVNKLSIDGSVQIFSGLDDENLGDKLLLIGSSSFSSIAERDEENNKYPVIKKSEKSNHITKMENRIGERQSAEDWLSRHPLSPGPEYLNQIKYMLNEQGLDSVTELDVEASSLGKAPALTNLGMITFYISNDTDELMVERNSVLVKTPFPIDNSNENLTEITNSILREKGVSIDEVSKIFKKKFGRGGSKHEIRAFNGRYDLEVLVNNLNPDCVEVIKKNINFTDTLRVAKAMDVGSLSSEKTLDLRDTNGSSVIKSVRVEDWEKFQKGELPVIITTSNKQKAETAGDVYSLKATKKNIALDATPSKKSNNNVQQILNTILAKKVVPDNPFHYKIINEYKSMDHVVSNISEVSKETGLSKDEIKTVLTSMDTFNENPTEEQKKLMEELNIDTVTKLFHEKHNNLDEMGDIDLEGVALMEEYRDRIISKNPDLTSDEIQDIINQTFLNTMNVSKNMKLSVVYQSAPASNSNQADQLMKLGREDRVAVNIIQVADNSSPLKIKPQINLVANNNLGETEVEVTEMLIQLHKYGREETEEYGYLKKCLFDRGLRFKQFSTVMQVKNLSNKYEEKQETANNAAVKIERDGEDLEPRELGVLKRKRNAMTKYVTDVIESTPLPITDVPKEFERVVKLMPKDQEFVELTETIGSATTSGSKNLTRVKDKVGLPEFKMQGDSVQSRARALINNIKKDVPEKRKEKDLGLSF